MKCKYCHEKLSILGDSVTLTERKDDGTVTVRTNYCDLDCLRAELMPVLDQ